MSKANAVVALEEPTLEMIVALTRTIKEYVDQLPISHAGGVTAERGRYAVDALRNLVLAAGIWMEEPAATHLLDTEDL